MSVFPPGGSHQRVRFVCVLPFLDGDARKDTKIYPGLGKRRSYVQRGEESLYYLAPKCLMNTGVYELGWRWSMEALLRVCVVLYRLLRIRSRASPFIVTRRDLGYMNRRQSRGR